MRRIGFTILEVLVGLSLLIVLAAGAYGLLLQLHTRQQEIARISARNTAGAVLVDALERAVLTCVAESRRDGSGLVITGSTARVVYRDMTPDLPTTSDAFSTSSRLVIIHHPDSFSAEVTRTIGARTETTTLANIERVRFRAYDAGAWVDEFDARSVGHLPKAVEIGVWFQRRGGSSSEENDEATAWREPDRLRVIAVFDADADMDAASVAASDGGAGA